MWDILSSLDRHDRGDWGNVCEHDRLENNRALDTDGRLFSVYDSKEGIRFLDNYRSGQKCDHGFSCPIEYWRTLPGGIPPGISVTVPRQVGYSSPRAHSQCFALGTCSREISHCSRSTKISPPPPPKLPRLRAKKTS